MIRLPVGFRPLGAAAVAPLPGVVVYWRAVDDWPEVQQAALWLHEERHHLQAGVVMLSVLVAVLVLGILGDLSLRVVLPWRAPLALLVTWWIFYGLNAGDLERKAKAIQLRYLQERGLSNDDK